MNMTLSKEVCQFLTKQLKEFGLSDDNVRWRDTLEFDLSDMTRTKARKLRELLVTCGKLKGASARIGDIDRWLAILDNPKAVRCRKIADFAPMLIQYLKMAPKHWLYKLRDNSESYQPYYITQIVYHPPQPATRNRDYRPPYVEMKTYWEELGRIRSCKVHFKREDVEDLTVARALHEAGYQIESPEMLESYLANRKKYIAIHDKVGKQFTATGTAEQYAEESESAWYRRNKTIHLERDGESARVVVDVLREGDDERGSGEHRPDAKFWMKAGCDFEGSDDDDDKDLSPGDEDEDDPAETEVVDIPLSPALICFDLKRHARMKIHTDQLTEYVYQTDLSNKLILPEEIIGLVSMLVSNKGGFTDIIGNKGGGAIILCAGSPGTGKTLTAEIYSEAMSRPLYSVQCSQLGTNPDDLEEELLKVFRRATRWNAILLLDEADVYVAARGRDLVQNAIVGVFLRVLEYYAGVLFLTTNRADLVDDAIASRCLARIDYRVPTPENQKRIWRTLADNAGISLADSEIDGIVSRYPHLSGRDVKNLLKLGSMVVASRGGELNEATIDFVKKFKPTTDVKV